MMARRENGKFFWIWLFIFWWGRLFFFSSLWFCLAASNSFRVPENRSLVALVEQADKSIRQKRYAQGFSRYFEVMEQDDNSVFSMGGKYLGFYLYCASRLQTLPLEARGEFERMYSHHSQRLFQKALRGGRSSVSILTKVVDKYFLTPSGREASFLLGDILLDRGHIRQAFRYYWKIFRYFPFERSSVEFSLLLLKMVVCIKRFSEVVSSDLAKIRRIYFACREAKAIFIGGRRLNLLDFFRRNLPHFFVYSVKLRGGKRLDCRILGRGVRFLRVFSRGRERVFSRARVLSISSPRFQPYGYTRANIRTQYWMFGGGNGHNGVGGSLLRVGRQVISPRYLTQYPVRKRSRWGRRYVWRNNRFVLVEDGEYVYAFMPALWGDNLVWATPNYLHSYDLKTGRKRFIRRITSSLFQEKNGEVLYSPVIYDGRIYASFITSYQNYRETYRGIPIKEAIPHRSLYCFDQRTGRVLWVKDGRVDSFFKRASVAVSPVVRDGVLYVSATVMGGYIQTFLVALDAQTGRVLWRTWVSSGALETTMFVYYAREPMGVMLAESEGVLYCATSQGGVVAVRALDGKILWIRRYEAMEIKAARRYYAQLRRIQWRNNPPVVYGDMVFVAPLDSEYFYALDKYSGDLRWYVPRSHPDWGGVYYVLGCWENLVFLSGRRVFAYEVDTGRLRWVGRLLGSQPAGRGCIVGENLVIPAVDRLFVLEGRTGKHLEYFYLPSSVPAGNVVVLQDYVILGSFSRFSVYRNRR